jgi:hypothetical protein
VRRNDASVVERRKTKSYRRHAQANLAARQRRVLAFDRQDIGNWNRYSVPRPSEAFQKPKRRRPFENPCSRRARWRLIFSRLRACQNSESPFHNHVILETVAMASPKVRICSGDFILNVE